MPKNRVRSTYPVVTGVVTFLALFSAASVVIRRNIPQPDEGPLANAPEDYLRDGSRLPYKFRELNQETLAEAKRLQRPLLVMVGSSGSRSAQQADAAGFKDLENAALIRARYIVCRVDATLQQALVTAYLPISRPRLGYDLGFQVFFLNPDGALYFHRTTDRPGDSWDVDAVANMLRSAHDRLSELQRRASDPEFRSLNDIHVNERDAILDPNLAGVVDLAKADQEFLASMDNKLGSWRRPWGTKLMPFAWEYLLLRGHTNQVEENLNPILQSGFVDWIDGGFFSQAREPGIGTIEFDKSAEVNASMAMLCAKLYRLTGKPRYRLLAEKSFDFISEHLVGDFGMIRPYQIGDPLPQGRSRHASFSPRKMRELFDERTRERLRQMFTLRVEENPQMIPAIRNIADFERNPEAYEELLRVMRADREDAERKKGSLPVCSIASYATARLLETARILDDPERIPIAQGLYEGLSRFMIQDPESDEVLDLRRCPRLTKDLPCQIADYLGFADAAYQFFLSSRSEFALEDGWRVLRKALRKGETGTPGVLFQVGPEAELNLPPETRTPEIADTDLPGSNAWAMRLCRLYAHAVQVRLHEAAGEFEVLEHSGIAHYGSLVQEVALGCSTFLSAAVEAEKDMIIHVRSVDRKQVRLISVAAPLVEVLPVDGDGADGVFEVWNGDRLVIRTNDAQAAARAAQTNLNAP